MAVFKVMKSCSRLSSLRHVHAMSPVKFTLFLRVMAASKMTNDESWKCSPGFFQMLGPCFFPWNSGVTSTDAVCIWGLDDDEDDPFPAGLLPMLDEEVPNHDDTAGSSTVPPTGPTGGFGEEALEQFTAIQHLLWELQQETEKDEADEAWRSQWGSSEMHAERKSCSRDASCQARVAEALWNKNSEAKSEFSHLNCCLPDVSDGQKKKASLRQLCRCIPA